MTDPARWEMSPDMRKHVAEQTVIKPDAGVVAGLKAAYTGQVAGAKPEVLEAAAAGAKGEPAGAVVISRARPRDAAKLLLCGHTVEGVSRLRFQGREFWFWEAGSYARQNDNTMRKAVGDFLYDAKCNSGDGLTPFNPKRRDIDEVLDALRLEAHLDECFAAPCWLPGGEAAGEWIVCENGIVSVQTGELRPHTHRLWTHGLLGFDWQPGAVCPVWERFLESVWPGDLEAWECLEEWLGLCMTLDTWPHKAMLLLGERRSGKSTIVHVIEKLAGRTGFVPLSFDKWVKGEFSAHSLLGKRAIIFSDVRLKEGKYFGRQWDAGGLGHESKEKLLNITGGDSVIFRKIYSTAVEWEGVLPGKVTLVSNEPPNFNDDILVTRFLKLHFKSDQELAGALDPLLGEKLERELPGIAVRCLTAYRRLRERGGFRQPKSGLELDRQLARARNPMLAMVLECLEIAEGEGDWVPKATAFQACGAWLRENGHGIFENVLRQEEMGDHIAAGFDHLRQLAGRQRFVQRVDGKRYWRRLRLSAEGRRLVGLDLAGD